MKDLEEARRLASEHITDQETEFKVCDEQNDCLMFIPDGTIYAEDGNEIE